MDIFDYKEHFLFRLMQAYDESRPLQVEMHIGIHCDLYHCPHCYGYGQAPIKGNPLEVVEVARFLDDLLEANPLIIVSGITTEPLTHPYAVEIIKEIRQRNLRLGLFTKGYRFDEACLDAVLIGNAECFVVFSVDAATRESYRILHGIPLHRIDKRNGTRSEDYYDVVMDNIRRFYTKKQQLGARAFNVQSRISILLLDENYDENSVTQSVDFYSEIADLVRFSFPQDRNDGMHPKNLPIRRKEILTQLYERFQNNPKVRILVSSSETDRDLNFKQCHTQRFQFTVDKSGNLFPCPQVAVSNFKHLSFGNIRNKPLGELLKSHDRKRLFGLDVTEDMHCRICDRKDEAINIAIDSLNREFTPTNWSCFKEALDT